MNRRYRFGPIERRPLAGPLRAGQFAVLAGGAALGLLALYVLRSLVGMVVALALLGAATALIALPIDGRTVEEWAPVAARWALRRRGAAAGYRSAASSKGTRVGADGEPRHELFLPAELAGLDLLAAHYGSGEVGILRDARAGTYTAALAVQGGPFILRDPGEQERALDAWGDVLASTARDGSPVRRVQWLEQTAPALGDELAAHFQTNRDRSVPLESDLVRSYVELVESAAPTATEHEVLIAVQIDERRGGRELRRRGGGVEAADKYEWGGHNANGSSGFAAERPDWEAPIHQLLADNDVTIFFHGHDHLFVKQDLDGVVYQEVPQPSYRQYDKTSSAQQYGYTSGDVLGCCGYLRVTVSPSAVTVDYVPSRQSVRSSPFGAAPTWTVSGYRVDRRIDLRTRLSVALTTTCRCRMSSGRSEAIVQDQISGPQPPSMPAGMSFVTPKRTKSPCGATWNRNFTAPMVRA